MSVVVLVLLFATVVAAIGLMVAMVTKDEPFYGAVGVGICSCPCPLLALLYLALA